MSVLTREQATIFKRGKDIATSILPTVEYLERLAEGIPELRERVAELRTRRDYLELMCTTCLSADTYDHSE